MDADYMALEKETSSRSSRLCKAEYLKMEEILHHLNLQNLVNNE